MGSSGGGEGDQAALAQALSSRRGGGQDLDVPIAGQGAPNDPLQSSGQAPSQRDQLAALLSSRGGGGGPPPGFGGGGDGNGQFGAARHGFRGFSTAGNAVPFKPPGG